METLHNSLFKKKVGCFTGQNFTKSKVKTTLNTKTSYIQQKKTNCKIKNFLKLLLLLVKTKFQSQTILNTKTVKKKLQLLPYFFQSFLTQKKTKKTFTQYSAQNFCKNRPFAFKT